MRWWALLAGSLLVAGGVPAAWWLAQPAPAVGAAVAEVGTAPALPADRAAGLEPGRPAPAATTGGEDLLPDLVARPATGPAAVVPPVRLRVPALGVDTAVDTVGRDDEGAMAVPEDIDRVGWYRWAAAPGEPQGSAVLAGHVDSAADGAGALQPLRTADVGDEVLVDLADGTVVRYTVAGREEVLKADLTSGPFFATEGEPRLTLITCGGPFDAERRSYRDNVVVVAVPAPPV